MILGSGILDRTTTTPSLNLQQPSHIHFFGSAIQLWISCRLVGRHKSCSSFGIWSGSSDSIQFGPFYNRARLVRVLLHHARRASRRPSAQNILADDTKGDHITYHDHNARTPSCRREALSPHLANLLQRCGSPACNFS